MIKAYESLLEALTGGFIKVGYLVSGKEGIITDTMPAIKADKRLKLKAKRDPIALVEELRSTITEEIVSPDPQATVMKNSRSKQTIHNLSISLRRRGLTW